MKNPKIAIIGYATRLPQTTDASFWKDLLAGRDLLTRVAEDRWPQYAFEHPSRSHPGTSVTFAAGSLGDVAGFDAGFFRISPREAAAMDPQQRLLLEMSWEALAHAGVRPRDLRGSRCGVFIGLASTDYGYRLADDLAAIGTNTATGCTGSIAANRLSYFYDLRGPSFVVDTACSSALVAFHQACQSIRQGESDLALTGAINLHLHPFGFLIFSRASMLSAGGRCRPFDAAADGYARSEGGGIFVLKDFDRARRDGDRILAVVAHTAINSDGHKSGLTVPSIPAQARLLEEAYTAANIDPAAIDYIEAHGTGTTVGDPVEVEAIGRALGVARPQGNRLPIGSVKSNLGHLETASGVPGLLKAIHCLRERTVPATIGIQSLNPRLALDDFNLEVVQENRPLKSDGTLVIGVNAFGFGGANAHVILHSAEPRKQRAARWPRRKGRQQSLPLLLSAATETALRQVAQDFADTLNGDGNADYARLYQANFRREPLRERVVLKAGDSRELQATLRAFAAGTEQAGVLTGSAMASPSGPVFVYSGNGCQWDGMGRALLDHPLVATTLDEIDHHFAPMAGYALRDDLAGRLGGGRYALTEHAQPALFALQVALTALLRAEGVEPVAVVGHSVGEVAAACACGILTLEDAVRVIYERSRLQGRSRGQGGMTAVASDGDTVADWLKDWGLAEQISIGAWNSVRGSTVVGPQAALDDLERHLRAQGTGFKRLEIDYPFHSAYLDPVREELLVALAGIQPRPARIPFVSAVTGQPVPGEALDAQYWWRNIREPVRFQEAATVLVAQWNVFVELGGHPVLRNYLQDTLSSADREGRIGETLRRQVDAPEAIWRAAASVWIAGIPTQWQAFYPQIPPVVDLPHYPWERERHWHTVTAESAGILSAFPVHPLLGHPVAQHPGTWEHVLDTQRLPFLADHRVGDGVVLAGAAYVEMFLAAACTQHPDNTAWSLEELEIRAPLLLENDVSKIVRLHLQDDGWASISARTQLEGDWTLHAKARLRADAPPLPGPGDVLEIVTKVAEQTPEFTASAHYALTRHVGLHYGPAFQTVECGWLTTDGVVARLNLGVGDSEEFLLHPALFDGAMQIVADWLAREDADNNGWGFVPIQIERLSLWQKASGSLWAQVRIRRQSPQSLLVDVQLLDGQARTVAQAEGVRLRRVRLQPRELERLRFLESVLVPHPQSSDVLPPLPAQDLRAALQAALDDSPAVTRYADEYAPLLSSLVLRYIEGDATGDEDIPTANIWHTLLRDYPEFFPMTLEAGRWGLHRSGQGEDSHALDFVAVAQDTVLRILNPSMVSFLQESVARLCATLPENRPIRVTEIATGAAEALPGIYASIPEDPRLHLCHLTLNADDVSEDTGWQTLPLDRPDLPPSDLLWLRLDAADTEQQWRMLEAAVQSIVEGGLLLIHGVHAEAGWRALNTQGKVLLPQDVCRDWLIQKGFSELPQDERNTVPVGPYAMLLTKTASPVDVGTSVPSGDWWILGPEPLASDHPDLQLLLASLERAGFRTHTTSELSTDTACSGILYLDLATETAADPVPHLTRACSGLITLGKWAVRQTPVVPVFLLTRGGILATYADAIGEETSAHTLNAAGLCGFARSLQNEWPELSLTILDLGAQSLTVQQVDRLLRYLQAPDAETEMVIDPHGARFVPRVQEASFPCPKPIEAVPRAGGAGGSTPYRQLRFSMPGQLRNLQWMPGNPPALADDAVRVEVAYAGLNFRDVMYALGMLSDEALENGFSGPGLGLEFAGWIREVGRKVTRWRPGDAVMGFAPSSFSTQICTPETVIAAVPAALDMASAAAVPTVFFTAWYALREMARLEENERVLIHGAAGGVGIAAIQISQMLGAEIYATAGSPEKRDFLRLMGVAHVYDSRSLAFADAILRDTQGEGVDVVLNSLSGEAIRRNLQVLRPFGRFLELGKRDFYENTPLGLRPFRNNISYYGIDADQLLAGRPALTRRLFDEIMTHFSQGDFFALPVARFPADRIVQAFRYMQQAKQIGKVVVEVKTPVTTGLHQECTYSPPMALDPDGAYLVTGGIAGFGLATAQRLVERGARHLILVSRTGVPDAAAAETIEGMRALGAEICCKACDVSDRHQVAALFAHLNAQPHPLRGIVHAAAVIKDALAENLTTAHIGQVLSPKVAGAWYLHRESLKLSLDFFVLYSSITTLLGNPGQAPYVAANTWLEGLARLRRAQNLPALSILWGPIGDIGYLTRHEKTRDLLQQRLGGAPLSASTALDLLETLLASDRTGLVVADFDWRAVSRFLPKSTAPRFSRIHRNGIDTGQDLVADLRTQMLGLSTKEAETVLNALVRQEVAQILRLAPEKIPGDQNLAQLGLDSLMGVELALALEERLGIKLPAFLLSEGPTPERLAQRLVHMLRKDGSDEALTDRSEIDALQRLAESHGVQSGSADAERLMSAEGL
jgi:acyl transferase domain-containing protein/NADPH:quinone reductase-like Zn-dependent oxidoreductase/acyl carrier protein